MAPRKPKNLQIPDWLKKLPFATGGKKPCRFSVDDGMTRLYGIGSNKVYTRTFLCTDKLSASSFKIPSGGNYFEPFDVHAGDEVYYIAAGKGVVFNPHTGFAQEAKEGDMVWIPKGVWHQAYNFGTEELSVVTAFAPKMWGADGIPASFDGKPLFYKMENSNWRNMPAGVYPKNWVMKLGRFPIDGPAARQKQEFFVVPPEKSLGVIQGSSNRVFISFHVSNDFIHAGKMNLPVNVESDQESHKGDELIYVASGTISIVLKDSGGNSPVSVERYEVKERERFFIPENVKHCYVNRSNRPAEIVFFVAPEL